MDSKITRLIEQASVIVGALPYLQAYRDKTFLIKFGGSAMDDPRLVKKLMRDIVLLEALGFNPVIVHGGGKAISKAMMEAGLEAHFINGLRVTTPEAISIVERTLSGTINPGLVQMFRDFGGKGVGIPGTEIFVGERIQEKDEQGNPKPIIKEQTTTKKHIQADTAAIIFTLTNGDPEHWRNRQTTEITGKDGKDLFAGKSDEELDNEIAELKRKLE